MCTDGHRHPQHPYFVHLQGDDPPSSRQRSNKRLWSFEESHLWEVAVVALEGPSRPWEEQVEVEEEGVGEAEGLPGEQAWLGLKGGLTLVTMSSPPPTPWLHDIISIYLRTLRARRSAPTSHALGHTPLRYESSVSMATSLHITEKERERECCGKYCAAGLIPAPR